MADRNIKGSKNNANAKNIETLLNEEDEIDELEPSGNENKEITTAKSENNSQTKETSKIKNKCTKNSNVSLITPETSETPSVPLKTLNPPTEVPTKFEQTPVESSQSNNEPIICSPTAKTLVKPSETIKASHASTETPSKLEDPPPQHKNYPKITSKTPNSSPNSSKPITLPTPSTESLPQHSEANLKPKFILGSTEDNLENAHIPLVGKPSPKQPQVPNPEPRSTVKHPFQINQRLFFRPIELEMDVSRNDVDRYSIDDYRVESPLLMNKSSSFVVPIGSSVLNRVSTCNSSLTHIGRDSTRRFRTGAQRKIRRRAILKNGECNILQSRTAKHRLRFLQDIFTTLVDAQWRWTLIVFALSFLLSWLGFAVIWWLIMFTHGDLKPEHLPKRQEESDWKPCVSEIYDFTSCFLFSIETQHTIGYGARTTSEECPEAIFIMCMQSIAGVMISAFMVGIVFAKMTRPKHRTQTLLFSRNAVVCQRDGFLCLMFRVGDMRKSHIIGASIRAQLIRPKTTKEGEILNHYQTELIVNADGCDGDLFFIWPMTIVHKIDEESPLYYLSAADMLQDRFEIVVILEGTIESTGQTTQARSSYVAAEVLWGHRFEPVVSYNKDRQGYAVNYSKFDNTLPVDTPLCSGADLNEFYRMQDGVSEYDHLQHYLHPLYPMYPDNIIPDKSMDFNPLILDQTKYRASSSASSVAKDDENTNATVQVNESRINDVENRDSNVQIRNMDFLDINKREFDPISDSSDTESLYSVRSRYCDEVDNRRITSQSVKNTLV